MIGYRRLNILNLLSIIKMVLFISFIVIVGYTVFMGSILNPNLIRLSMEHMLGSKDSYVHMYKYMYDINLAESEIVIQDVFAEIESKEIEKVESENKAIADNSFKSSNIPIDVNEDIALAALSVALNINGTLKGSSDLYKKIVQDINPGPNTESCDCSTSTILRWTGADVNVPKANRRAVYEYLSSNPEKWEEVDRNNPQPGDVIVSTTPSKVTPSHVFIYIGKDFMDKVGFKPKNPRANAVSGSLVGSNPTISPGRGPAVTDEYDSNWTRRQWGSWKAYRRKPAKRDSKFWNAGGLNYRDFVNVKAGD